MHEQTQHIRILNFYFVSIRKSRETPILQAFFCVFIYSALSCWNLLPKINKIFVVKLIQLGEELCPLRTRKFGIGCYGCLWLLVAVDCFPQLATIIWFSSSSKIFSCHFRVMWSVEVYTLIMFESRGFSFCSAIFSPRGLQEKNVPRNLLEVDW